MNPKVELLLKIAFSTVSATKFKIMEMHLREGKSFAEIGHNLEMTRQGAAKHYNEALTSISKQYEL